MSSLHIRQSKINFDIQYFKFQNVLYLRAYSGFSIKHYFDIYVHILIKAHTLIIDCEYIQI